MIDRHERQSIVNLIEAIVQRTFAEQKAKKSLDIHDEAAFSKLARETAEKVQQFMLGLNI